MSYLNRVGGGYETPTLEVIEVAVEQGFAASDLTNALGQPIDPWDYDGETIE